VCQELVVVVAATCGLFYRRRNRFDITLLITFVTCLEITNVLGNALATSVVGTMGGDSDIKQLNNSIILKNRSTKPPLDFKGVL
jgi:hypothetical protein